MTQNKREKTILIKIIIFFTAFLLISAAIGGTYFVIKQSTTNQAVAFLCDKYAFKKDDIELLDYEQGHKTIYTRDGGLPISEYIKAYSNYKWKFKVNDRTFFVNYEGHKFYDDYQLEEIEEWSTKWLQENVDPQIVGIECSTYNIIDYQKSMERDGNEYIFTKEKIYDFISNNKAFNADYTYIFYYASNEFDDEKYSNSIKDRIKKNISENPYLLLYPITDHKMSLYYEKTDINYNSIRRFEWYRICCSSQYWERFVL